MPTVDLVTMCCPKDIYHTYAGWDALVGSHKYPFRDVMLIRQRCRGIDAGTLDPSVRIVESEDYPDIFDDYGIDVDDPDVLRVEARDNRYFWKYHSMNHFIGLKVSSADYIAFTDCDNLLDGDVEGNSWVDRGMHILQSQPGALMICPNQSGPRQRGDQRVKVISQCMFLCERQRFLNLDYNVPCPSGVELNNFYLQFEGRLWRYCQKHDVYRVMLGWPPLMKHLAW